MIKINLLKETKRKREFRLDLSRLKEIDYTAFLKSKAIFAIPVVGLIVFAGEVIYYFKVRSEVTELKTEIENLKVQKQMLKAKVEDRKRQLEELKRRIASIKARIEEIERSKDLLIALKSYYVYADKFMNIVLTEIPSSVWIKQVSQEFSFDSITVNVEVSGYSISSIKRFIEELKKEFETFKPGSIVKETNPYGIIFYTASVSLTKNVGGRGL